MITVNGRQCPADGMSIAELLTATGDDARRVAVELNGSIAARARHDELVLHDGDCVEIVRFVGGG